MSAVWLGDYLSSTAWPSSSRTTQAGDCSWSALSLLQAKVNKLQVCRVGACLLVVLEVHNTTINATLAERRTPLRTSHAAPINNDVQYVHLWLCLESERQPAAEDLQCCAPLVCGASAYGAVSTLINSEPKLPFKLGSAGDRKYLYESTVFCTAWVVQLVSCHKKCP